MKKPMAFLGAMLLGAVPASAAMETGVGWRVSFETEIRCLKEDTKCQQEPKGSDAYATRIYVDEVACSGPAEESGIQVNDEIISIGEQVVVGQNVEMMQLILSEADRASSVIVRTLRKVDGERRFFARTVTPAEYEDNFTCGEIPRLEIERRTQD